MKHMRNNHAHHGPTRPPLYPPPYLSTGTNRDLLAFLITSSIDGALLSDSHTFTIKIFGGAPMGIWGIGFAGKWEIRSWRIADPGLGLRLTDRRFEEISVLEYSTGIQGLRMMTKDFQSDLPIYLLVYLLFIEKRTVLSWHLLPSRTHTQ